MIFVIKLLWPSCCYSAAASHYHYRKYYFDYKAQMVFAVFTSYVQAKFSRYEKYFCDFQ